MAPDSNPGKPDSPSGDNAEAAKPPVITTPINTCSHTLHRFGNRSIVTKQVYSELADEMSPYFVGPMPVSDFLEEFLPLPVTEVELPFTAGMFASVLASQDEAGMYSPFMSALNPLLTNHQIYCTSNLEERLKTDFPFKIKPDCSVFAKEHPFLGTDSSAVELFIEFKRWHDDDPFVTVLPQTDNTTAPPIPNPFTKSSQDSRLTCGKITAYATSHMSAQYRTHVFFVLICRDYARLIRWDRSGAIVTCPIYYDSSPDLIDFFIRFDDAKSDVRGQDTSVRVANFEDTKDAVEDIQEFKELVDSQISLLVVSVPGPATGETSEYVIKPPTASPWLPVGRWTRTSIGYDIREKRTIFMKDYWRPVGALKEGDVYSRFDKNSVPNVPHCSNSGDIGDDKYHSTRTDRFSSWNPNYSYDFTQRRHYRLILDDIGQPLEKFKRSRDMVSAVYAALIAHKHAYKCGILHRDISHGNILITSDNKFNGGLLIDWDLCKDIESQVDKPSRAARTGTWQFLAADLVVNPKINHTFVHDLESAYYVILWLSIRFLHNSFTSQERGIVMDDVFNPSAGSSSKLDWMIASSGIFTNDLKINGNSPLPLLIRGLNDDFLERHRCSKALQEARGRAIVPRFGKPQPTVDLEDLEKKLKKIDAELNHDTIIAKFRTALDYPEWPADEPAVEQIIDDIGRDKLCLKSKTKTKSSKTSLSRYTGVGSVGKEGSSQKRLRIE